MDEFLLDTALLMQEYLLPILVLMLILFVTGIMLSKEKVLAFVAIVGWLMLALYGVYLM